jgi:hypothetical protein
MQKRCGLAMASLLLLGMSGTSHALDWSGYWRAARA